MSVFHYEVVDARVARTNLFIDCASVSEDDVAANEAGEERVKAPLFATVCLLLDQQQGLV